MNQIRSNQALNTRELENCVSPNASWHSDYRHTAFVYIGGLPFQLSEGDIVTIFSQYGVPTYIKLARDNETGKSRGFGWLKYEDQRSCDLAVDNLGGVEVMGRMLRVDHAEYKKKDGEEDDGGIDLLDGEQSDETEQENRHQGDKHEQKRVRDAGAGRTKRPVLKEELELDALLQNHDDDDPMKGYMIQEKRDAVEAAIAHWEKEDRSRRRDKEAGDKSRRHRHHHRTKRYGENEGRRRGRDSLSPSSDAERHRKRHRRRSTSTRERSISVGRRRTPPRESRRNRFRSHSHSMSPRTR